MAVSDAGCHLCGQIEGDPRRDLIAQLLAGEPYVRRVVLDTASFAALPSLGPLAEGHVLLCPRAHLRSAAALPLELHAEFESARAKLVHRLTAAYGGAVHLFEHGMATPDGRTVCTVDHAHVHLVPLPERVRRLDLDGESWQAFDGTLPGAAALVRGREYVMYIPPQGQPLLCTGAGERVESQYMRRAVARALGSRIWDWRSAPDAASAHRTWQILASPDAVALEQ